MDPKEEVDHLVRALVKIAENMDMSLLTRRELNVFRSFVATMRLRHGEGGSVSRSETVRMSSEELRSLLSESGRGDGQ